MQRTSVTGDNGGRLTQSRTRKRGKAGSKPAVIMRDWIIAIKENDAETLPLTEEPASTSAASEYDVILETASFTYPDKIQEKDAYEIIVVKIENCGHACGSRSSEPESRFQIF